MTPPAVELPADPRDFDFFQLVRVLEARLGTQIGGPGAAQDERIRLRPSTSLAHPTSDVAAVAPLRDGRVQVTVNFLGLYGATTPLPRAYAEQLRWDERDYPQMRAFLDLFHHRLLSLFYRTWRRHRYEQSYRPDATDPISRILLGLVALHPEEGAAQLGMEPARVLHYLGLLLQRARPAHGLCVLLGAELPWTLVSVTPCTPRWITVPPEDRVRLSPASKARLGHDILVGTRCLDRQGQITIVLGPVTYADLLVLMPGQPGQERVRALVRLYARQPLDIVLRILVPRDELVGSRGYRLGGGEPRRLGQGAMAGPPKSPMVTFEFLVPML